MSSIKTNELSSHYDMVNAFKNCYAFLWQFVLMGPNRVALSKQTRDFSSLTDFPLQYVPMLTGCSLLNKKKVRSLIQKGEFDSNRLEKSCTWNGFEMESLKVQVVVCYNGDVVGTFYLDPFQKPHAKNGYEMEPLDVTLKNLFLKECESAYLKPSISKPFFQQQLPETTVSAKEGILEECSVSADLKPTISNEVNQQLPTQTKEFEKEDLLKECSVSTNVKPTISNSFHQQQPSQTKEFEKENLLEEYSASTDMKPTISNSFHQQPPSETKEIVKNLDGFRQPTEKPVLSTVSNSEVESQTSDHVPDCISMKSAQTCDECRETIKAKKFFDERRFGILEKCMCVICYGCIRKSTGTSNAVVKGPVRCPRCFVKSDKVASSASWIEGKEKVEFFKEYCKNLENTNIKLRLGWTCFPTRKNDVWTRRPYMLPVN